MTYKDGGHFFIGAPALVGQLRPAAGVAAEAEKGAAEAEMTDERDVYEYYR